MTYPPQPSPLFLVDPGEGVTLAARERTTFVHVDAAESSAVHRAVANLHADLAQVSGSHVVPSDADANIVVGTIGVSAAVDAALARGAIDGRRLHDEDGLLRWEGFMLTVAEDTLYLVGTDRRGTIYAVYDFLERIGVSPWAWWGDVPVRRRGDVSVSSDAHIVDWPSVRYRGVFLNDEEELFHWSRAHTADGVIGPETYARVFELLLRLKGNYLWPAMHTGAFNHDPANGRLAHDMGIVIGSSHCDMLLRSNEHEFRPWVDSLGEEIRYDYSLPGRNRERLQEYWRSSVEQNGAYEVTWTVGIRGVHDSGFEAAAIDTDESLSEDQKLRARVDLLERAIHDQRSILSDVLRTDVTRAPQLFIPYKEVLPLYDAGLTLPDDVTVVWANDNFGYLRRFPSEAELGRSGGHGLYYHSSYWSDYSTSYLATSSTPLALMRSELAKAWDRGIRRLWVDNIGGLKPLEIEMTFFLRTAWEAGRPSSTSDVREFVAGWIDATFSGAHGHDAGDIYAQYYALNNQRKIEHLESDAFAQIGWGDEAGTRLNALRRLYERTNTILRALPADERDAFFQLFAVKIHMAYLTSAQFYFADRSTYAHRLGAPAAADEAVALSRRLDDQRRALIHFYNHVMSNGRWNGMFTPEQFPPPVMPQSPAATPALRIDGTGITATAWGTGASESPTLTFWPGGQASKWIELFATGLPGVDAAIDATPGIDVQRRLRIEASARLPVSVVAPLPEGRGAIRITALSTGEVITVPVFTPRPAVAPAPTAWLEADGAVSMDPSLGVRHDGAGSSWRLVPDLGRYANAALQAVSQESPPDVRDDAGSVSLTFSLVTAGRHALVLHRLPTLDSTGRIRLAVAVDDAPPFTVESPTTDEHRGAWSTAIKDNVERLHVELPFLGIGVHVVRLLVVDAGVTLSKVEVITRQEHLTSLGAPFSGIGGPVDLPMEPDPTAFARTALDHDAIELYRTDPDTVPLRPQPYADHTFWTGETTFRPTPTVAQTTRAQPRSTWLADGSKDVVASLPRGPVTEFQGVLAFEAENVLAESTFAWRTTGADGSRWTHTQAETEGRAGLAMYVPAAGKQWDEPGIAPGLHFSLDVHSGGSYRAWALVHFEDDHDDSFVFAVDGVPQPVSEQFSRGEMCTYGTRQVWLWAHVSDLSLGEGRHTLSVLAREAGLRIDRLYLTLGDELPPVDADWVPSPTAVGLHADGVD